MKKLASLFLALVLIVSVVPALALDLPETMLNNEPASDGHPGDPNLPWTGELTVATSFPQARKEQVLGNFEKLYGIKVTTIEEGTAALIARLDAEKENPSADIMIGGMVTSYYQPYSYLYQEYTPKNDAYYPEAYKVVDGKFPIYSTELYMTLVNTELMEEGGYTLEDFDSYEKLLNPEFKDQVCLADPSKAASGYEHLVQELVDFGDPADNYEAGWAYVDKLLDNAVVLSSSGAVPRGVGEGEYLCGIIYESTVCNFISDGYPIQIVYPKEGVIVGCNASGIVKDCKNLRSAQLFMEWITSIDFQKLESAAPTYTRASLCDMPEDFPGKNMSELEAAGIPIMYGDPEYFITNNGDVVKRHNDLLQSKQK